MSIFSKLRGAKKAAAEHKKAETNNEEPIRKPEKYKHIPTHAAIDALSGAPSSWKAEDRSKIQAQHKRRSAMVSRTTSGFSTPTLVRNSSYNGSTWGNEGRPTPHNTTMFRQYDAGVGRSSPLASHDISPEASCSNSTNSNSSSRKSISALSATARATYGTAEILEIRHNPRPTYRPQQVEGSIFDNLHKSTTRRVGEAPLYDSPPPRPQAAVAAPMKTQAVPPKRRFGFGKKSTAIAV
ncbi:MAG: hypothetical protein M1835_007794 [Candelina submexicana]|nr:MAG: hypothetical protein M1835_007794 [Candelina submexicana]